MDKLAMILPGILAVLALFISVRTATEKKAPWWAVALYWMTVCVYWWIRSTGV